MKKPEDELAEIKSMMERSTRFLSLSGLSGMLAGMYALLGVGIAWYWVYGSSQGQWAVLPPLRELIPRLLLLAIGILIAAVTTAYLLSRKNSTQNTEAFWSPATKRFLQALFLPVGVGGLFCFTLVHEGAFALIPACTLLFYGLGLVQAAPFTLGEIKYLGWVQLILGILAAFVPALGLLCWALGFGVFHLVYGALMYYRHEH